MRPRETFLPGPRKVRRTSPLSAFQITAVAVEHSSDQSPAVGAERDVDDLCHRSTDDRKIAGTGSRQVIPFPTAQFGRAVGEKAVHPTRVVCCQLALRLGNTTEINRLFKCRIHPFEFRVGFGLSEPCPFRSDPLPGNAREAQQK